MEPTIVQFRQKALRMRNADPEAFDDFLATFRTYTNAVITALSEADQATILNLQGRLQQCRALIRIFEECDRHAIRPVP